MTIPAPNILFLVHRVPFPPNRGDRIRSYHLLRFLAERGRVHLATLADEPVDAKTLDVLRGLTHRLTIEPVPRRARWLHAARSLAAGQSATRGLFHSPRLKRTVREWARVTRFDAALVFCSSMVQYLDGIELPRVVVDLVDVDSQKWFDYAETARGMRRALYAWEGRQLRRLEKSLPRQFQGVTLVSEAEAALFQSFCPNSRTAAVQNGVDLDQFQPCSDSRSKSQYTCVFVGVLDYRANVEGLRWFCEAVWPAVRRRVPEASFAIVGRNPCTAVQRLASVAGVQVIGEVPDVRPYVAAAQISVAPLKVARGIQNKVLEAMAMARPVVASPEALQGLRAEPGLHALSPGSLSEWVDSIEQLHNDAQRRRTLGRAARGYVEQNHSWEASLSPMADVLGVSASLVCVSPAGAAW